MKRLLLIAIIIVAGNSFLKAQDFTASHAISIQGGIAFPFAEFAENSFEHNYPGFATTGGSIDIEYIQFRKEMTGFFMDLGYAWMGFDNEAFLDSYRPLITDPSLLVQTGNYGIVQVNFGYLIYTSLENNIRLMAIPSMGFVAMKHPEISVADNESTVVNSIESTTGYSSVLGLKLKVSYNVTEKLGLGLGYNLRVGGPYFEDKTSLEGTFWLPVRYHGAQIGVYYNFSSTGE